MLGLPGSFTSGFGLRFHCALLLTSVSASAVQQAWIAKYSSGPASTNHAVAMGLDAESNIYVIGHSTRTNAPYDFDYVVIKYNAVGMQQWANRIGSSAADDRVRAMAVTSDGVVVTGTGGTVKFLSGGLTAWTASYTGSDIKVDSNGMAHVTGFQTDAYSVVKISPSGSNVWLRTWDASPREDIAQKVAVDNSGNVFLAGLTTFACDRIRCYYEMRGIKFDSSGGFLSSHLLVQGDHRLDTEYKAIEYDAEGNLYLAMNRHDGGGFFPWSTRKFSPTGVLLWAKALNVVQGLEGVMSMELDREANVYYTGVNPNTGAIESHKINTDGTNIWDAYYLPSAGRHRGNGIMPDAAGNAYVTGLSAGVGSGNDYVTIKYGTNGQQLWVQRYTEAGNSDDQATAIAVSPNGDVYVTGFSNPSPGTYEITTIKYVQIAPIEKKSNGNILLSFCGSPGSNYVIEACAGLTNWTAIGTTTAGTTGLYTFEDTNAPSYRQRFYRTKQE